ncbi:MAG: hypothetical protein ACFE8M_12625 [Candidatus Hermodarchaeota archaeon]
MAFTPTIEGIVFLITFFVIFGVFLVFDVFKRNEKYGYLAYIMALLPTDVLWGMGFDVLGVYLVLFILWDICLARDLYGVASEKKEINEIILYFFLAIIIQIILAGILPASIPSMQQNTRLYWFAYMPNIYLGPPDYAINFAWVDLGILMGFRIAATISVGLVILPLLIDLKGEEVPIPVFIVIIALFVMPFLYLSYIWLPQAMAVLTFLFSVILFIVLLLITRSGKEVQVKTTQQKKK